MKTKITLITLVLLIIHQCSAQQSMEKSELEQRGIKGKVKQTTQSYYLAIEKDNVIVKGEKIGPSEKNYFIKYNEWGNSIEELTYDKDSLLKTKVSCKYNDKNKPLEMIGYNSENALPNINYKLTWKYDSLGGILETNNFQSDGTMYEQHKFTYKYDPQGNRIEENQFSFNGDLYRKYTYKYDDKGNPLEQNIYFKNGSLIDRYTYSRDSIGNEIEYSHYNSDNHLVARVSNKFDTKGNKIEWNEYNAKQNLKNRDVKQFDEKGNTIEEFFYDGKGKLIDTHTWKYDYDQKGNWIKKIEFKDNKPKFITIRQIEYYM